MRRPFLSWQEWTAAALVAFTPYAIHWWALTLVPVIVALVMWGSHRRLSAPPAEHEQGHR